MVRHSLRAFSLFACFGNAFSIDNGFNEPPMGWSALYGAPFNQVNETIVKEAARGLNASGLLEAGYGYVVLDDWFAKRDANGKMIANPGTFPSGMPAVSDAVHAAGVKFGVYSAASERTCGNWSASLFSETNDANVFANEWKIDYLKYDACIYNFGVAPRARYQAMGRALNATGRQIFYSVEGWLPEDGNWGPEIANMWRTGSDIWPNWDDHPNCIMNNIYQTNIAAPYHKVGSGFNDPDMLQPPNTLKTVLSPGLAPEEAYSQFKLWVIMKSPLMLGLNYAQIADLKTLEGKYYSLITNPEMLAINKDKSEQARVVAQMPSKAQQTLQGRAPGPINVTLQECDLTRVNQRFEMVGGQIALSGTNLCLGEAMVSGASKLVLTTCGSAASSFTWLKQNDQITVAKSAKSGMCVQADDANMHPTMQKCIYEGPFPIPISSEVRPASQMLVWGGLNKQLVSAGNGMCLTAGEELYAPVNNRWVTSNGTLEHEIWMGKLTPIERNGAITQRRVIALFNKGSAMEDVVAPAEYIGTLGAQAPVKIRNVVDRVDGADLAPGADLQVNVPSHGVAVYVIEA